MSARVQLRTPDGEETHGLTSATEILLWNILEELRKKEHKEPEPEPETEEKAKAPVKKGRKQ